MDANEKIIVAVEDTMTEINELYADSDAEGDGSDFIDEAKEILENAVREHGCYVQFGNASLSGVGSRYFYIFRSADPDMICAVEECCGKIRVTA